MRDWLKEPIWKNLICAEIVLVVTVMTVVLSGMVVGYLLQCVTARSSSAYVWLVSL